MSSPAGRGAVGASSGFPWRLSFALDRCSPGARPMMQFERQLGIYLPVLTHPEPLPTWPPVPPGRRLRTMQKGRAPTAAPAAPITLCTTPLHTLTLHSAHRTYLYPPPTPPSASGTPGPSLNYPAKGNTCTPTSLAAPSGPPTPCPPPGASAPVHPRPTQPPSAG